MAKTDRCGYCDTPQLLDIDLGKYKIIRPDDRIHYASFINIENLTTEELLNTVSVRRKLRTEDAYNYEKEDYKSNETLCSFFLTEKQVTHIMKKFKKKIKPSSPFLYVFRPGETENGRDGMFHLQVNSSANQDNLMMFHGGVEVKFLDQEMSRAEVYYNQYFKVTQTFHSPRCFRNFLIEMLVVRQNVLLFILDPEFEVPRAMAHWPTSCCLCITADRQDVTVFHSHRPRDAVCCGKVNHQRWWSFLDNERGFDALKAWLQDRLYQQFPTMDLSHRQLVMLEEQMERDDVDGLEVMQM